MSPDPDGGQVPRSNLDMALRPESHACVGSSFGVRHATFLNEFNKRASDIRPNYRPLLPNPALCGGTKVGADRPSIAQAVHCPRVEEFPALGKEVGSPIGCLHPIWIYVS